MIYNIMHIKNQSPALLSFAIVSSSETFLERCTKEVGRNGDLSTGLA